jgi:hypothetical protein
MTNLEDSATIRVLSKYELGPFQFALQNILKC